MKNNIILIILFILSVATYAQDQTVTGNLRVNHSIVTKADIYVGEFEVPGKMGLGSKLYFGGNDFNTDFIWLAKFVSEDKARTELRVNIGDDSGISDRFVVGNIKWDSNNTWKDWFVVTEFGVGIKTSNPSCALDVNGTIRSKEVKIEASGWSDFVFDKNYDLPKLSDVEKHINEKQHLPGIPSEKEILENGISVGEMQAKLLQKIEELTLYVIEQDKKIKILQKENISIKNELVNLKK
ncbi:MULTISPECIES: hypothetical protein [unclassified Dysgonomonas]|jgi:hypothetical protein|uniref:hypothetical protein n=1 Tax=unclassified Dysgonomonas TaxID=2630389 RepID=UPI0025C71174|nr:MULTISPECIES: hypothetical protein [unclassified Dysgonomonas]MDR2003784.1 hypothetical protein [Prevotella sp.]HMM03222.1 hypothetical protein [Dysgonomonas sp.]